MPPINWPNSTKEPMDIRDLLQMNKKMIEELHDRWTNPQWPWSSFTFDPSAVLEEIDLFLKEGDKTKVKFREFF
jgi:hypothetical protein